MPDVQGQVADLLCYLPAYRVIICRVHGAIQNWDTHLQRAHHIPKGIRRALQDQKGFHQLQLYPPAQIPLPAPFSPPLPILGEPIDAFACQEQGCSFLSTHVKAVRRHLSQEHCWYATKADPQRWSQVKVQTFFKTGGLQRYFTVSCPAAAPASTQQAMLRTSSQEATYILAEAQEAQRRQKEAQDIAEATTAKTDRTGWFNRNRWPEHLSGCNLAQLSWASRLPDRQDALLSQAAIVVDQLIEQAVAGLSTLPLETRRWLRSPKGNEIDIRPLARLQNQESQQRYAGYLKRFLCYCLRIAIALAEEGDKEIEGEKEEEGGRKRKRQRNEARRTRQTQAGSQASSRASSGACMLVRRQTPAYPACYWEGEESDAGSEGSASDSRADQAEPLNIRRLPPTQQPDDPLHDAKALFPWVGQQKELAMSLVHSLHLDDIATQIEQAKALFGAFIFQDVDNDPFSSGLIHFLAILGIHPEAQRLRLAQDYSYMLAGVVYCVRVLAVEIVLPAAQRREQRREERLLFLQRRQQYLVDGAYSPFSTMISLLAYAKHIAFNTSNSATMQWSKDLNTLYFRGRPIVVVRFKAMVAGVLAEAEAILWEKLMMVPCPENRFQIALQNLEDDVSCSARGYSFLSRSENGLGQGLAWIVQRLLDSPQGQDMRTRGQWHPLAVRRYIQHTNTFLEQLFFLVHVTGGQPARGTEIGSARFRNGFMQDRNIYVMDGQVAFVSRYNKTQSQWDKPKVIPRFLPGPVGQLLVTYLAYVSPLREHLLGDVLGQAQSDYLWSNNTGPWETDRLTRVLARETGIWLGCRLTMLEYRHVVATIGREVVGQEFHHGSREAVLGEEAIEEPELEREDGLDLQAGRSERIGLQSYGVPVEMVQHLSARSVHFFCRLSSQWHNFLGFIDSKPAAEVDSRWPHGGEVGKKRPRLSWSQSPKSKAKKGAFALQVEEGKEACELRPAAALKRLPSRHAPQGPRHSIAGLEPLPCQLLAALQKALGQSNAAYKSEEQEIALHAVVAGETPLVVVLPTGGGKSLLFLAPACLDDPGVTVVVVPFRELLNSLKRRMQAIGLQSIEWVEGWEGEGQTATVVVVSADCAGSWGFMRYAQQLLQQRRLRRVVVDECHLTYTSSDYRERLALLRNLRSLACPLLLLTATQPPCLEHELGEAMLVQTARYIRASTVRPTIRYLVQRCPAGQLVTTAVQISRRWQRQLLAGQKGVIYCRTKELCEQIALIIGCPYYHAGVDPGGRTQRIAGWLDRGGLVVATSALGTGVDYPGIVRILHVGKPYGMIDFAQESGRGGRAGEAVDSVVLVEQQKAGTKPLLGCRQSDWRVLDQGAMDAFLQAGSGVCRRAVMGAFLDGQATSCTDVDGAKCDRCGEGVTEWHTAQTKEARERARVIWWLDSMANGCPACSLLVVWGEEPLGNLPCLHSTPACTHPDAQTHQVARSAIRSRIQYRQDSHTCYRCGVSQQLCATGNDTRLPCQWPDVYIPVMAGVFVSRETGWPILERVGFQMPESPGLGDVDMYCKWIGSRHERRIWGDLMSNGMAVLIAVILHLDRET